ncbi:MAG: hypothetical protein PSX36_09195 [bacterium]|nr:hypothetical protein [bacterium]
MFNDLKKFEADDSTIFVIGSSHAYRGYDPRIFEAAGIKLFNMGTSGQNMKDSYTLIKANQSKIHRLVVDIYPGVLEEVSEESTLMLIQNVNVNRIAFEILKNNVTINSINNMTARLFDLNHKSLPVREKYIYNGYVERDTYFKSDSNRAFGSFTPGGNFIYLDSMLNFCSSHFINTWIASHPLKWNASYRNYYKNSYLPWIQKILSKYPDVVFLDFTLNHSNSDSLFSDEGHLNQRGVNYYNNMLLRKLSEF